MLTPADGSNAPDPAPGLRDFYRGRRVLVVGADGFLGVNCVCALERLGAQVTALTRRAAPRAPGFAGRAIRGDLMDRAVVAEAVAGQSVVFDFAGVSGAVDSNEDPELDLETACRPHLRLFRACVDARPSPVVAFCSSRLVYGKPTYLPVDEAHPLAPQSAYAVHKITLENYLGLLAHGRGLRACVLRLSNPYGPYQPLEARSYSVLNAFIRAAARRERIVIFGDGNQERDYIHVEDVIATFLLAAMNERAIGRVLNLGGRRSISIRSAVETLARLAPGVEIDFQAWPENFRLVETGDYRTDLAEVGRVLAPPPQLSFEVGLLRTLEFYREEERTALATNAPAP